MRAIFNVRAITVHDLYRIIKNNDAYTESKLFEVKVLIVFLNIINFLLYRKRYYLFLTQRHIKFVKSRVFLITFWDSIWSRNIWISLYKMSLICLKEKCRILQIFIQLSTYFIYFIKYLVKICIIKRLLLNIKCYVRDSLVSKVLFSLSVSRRRNWEKTLQYEIEYFASTDTMNVLSKCSIILVQHFNRRLSKNIKVSLILLIL